MGKQNKMGEKKLVPTAVNQELLFLDYWQFAFL